MTDEKKTLTEDILGEFGFRVVWQYDAVIAYVTAYKIAARGDLANTPMFDKLLKGMTNDPVVPLTTAHQEADSYLHGFLQADGKTLLDQGNHEWRDEQGLIKHCMLIRYLWQRAHQLIERSDCRGKTD